jgi:subtilisin family serine protease
MSIGLLIVLIAASIGTATASPLLQGGKGAAIRLKGATFVPGSGQLPALAPGLTSAGPAAGQRGYYLVQFHGPVQQAWKDELAGQGIELLDYVPDYAFKVRMTPAQAQQTRALAKVAWVGVFQPAYKLDTNLKGGAQALYKVSVERGADAGQTTAVIAQSGAQILRRDGQLLVVAASAAQLSAIARVEDVAWVENFALPKTLDQYARGIMGADAANAAHSNSSSYDGSSQTVAVADTGLGGGTPTTAHPDINGRVTAVYNWPGTTDTCFKTIADDGAQDVDSGHGTHVAGSVLSNGANSPGGLGKGVAPAARLVFQATENWVITSSLCKSAYGYQDGYYLTGLPTDLHTLFQQAYDAGARIHSNSWGSAAAGDYTTNSANADDFIWGHRDMLITFSAGNEGADANNDGVVDSDSIGSPATAKNVLTVGASENDRQGNYACDTGLTYVSHDTTYQSSQTCSSMGGQNLLGTPGQRWGFTTPPISTDQTAGNSAQMAAFSSRGPTDDGRIKPDVVAPGTWILSTYSGKYREGYDASPNPKNNAYQSDGWGIAVNQYYKYFGGTSMSNPLTAGAAAVVRDFYQKAYGANASAALVKATLINSAVDMADENNDGANDNDFPIPNVHEGWGRVNVDAATDGTAKYDDTRSVSTGANVAYTANVAISGALKISLVWSDYPSTAAAAANLVNNLNLTVTAPGGATYKGNVFSGGWSAAGGSADTANNVENVYVQSAATGNWTITVSGANVPNGPQPFALVVRGAGSLTGPAVVALPSAPSSLTATVVSKTQINLSWADNSSDETGFKIERSTSSTTGFTQVGTTGPGVTTFQSTGLTGNTTYYYRVRATNANGDSGYSNTASAKTLRK